MQVQMKMLLTKAQFVHLLSKATGTGSHESHTGEAARQPHRAASFTHFLNILHPVMQEATLSMLQNVVVPMPLAAIQTRRVFNLE